MTSTAGASTTTAASATAATPAASMTPAVRLEAVTTLQLGSRIGQLRAAPVRRGAGQPPALLAVYGADFDVDPYVEMFFFPTDTLKLALFTAQGEILWRRDLGRAIVPGVWFCPVLPFDLDGDGVDEIWFVDNVNLQHPLGLSGYRLARLDARTGELTGHWPWPNTGNDQSLSHQFRNFLVGGYAHREPVLVTAQGTYGTMRLQGWKPDMAPRWEVTIPKEAPGARGSHMTAIADLDGDGVDELLWGERPIRLDTGAERFCADRDVYQGHSDIAQPVLDRSAAADGTSSGPGRWLLYTCRESDRQAQPRVVMYDDQGRRLWGDVDEGHMDIGWVARLGGPGDAGDARQDGQDGLDRQVGGWEQAGELVAMSIRIGQKFCGPDGRWHTGTQPFSWDALSGAPLTLPFDAYKTIPVDLNGDGRHELVRGQPGGDGEVLDRHGRRLGSVGGAVAMASRFLDRPGEHLLSYAEDGTVRLWADRGAEDTPAALVRYAHPAYATNQRLTAVGYNLINLCGL